MPPAVTRYRRVVSALAARQVARRYALCRSQHLARRSFGYHPWATDAEKSASHHKTIFDLAVVLQTRMMRALSGKPVRHAARIDPHECAWPQVAY